MLYKSLTLFGVKFDTKASEVSSDAYDKVITFKNNTIDEDVKNMIEDEGGEIVKEIPQIGALEVKCDTELLSKINEEESVSGEAINKLIQLNDNEDKYFKSDNPKYYTDKGEAYYKGSLYDKSQWDIKRVTNNGASFYLEPGNHSIVVGIVDSGIDSDHPDLKGNYLGGKNFVPKGYMGDETETGNISDVEDRFGHGTMVAGEVAADGRTKGVAPKIGFKSYRIFNKSGATSIFAIADGITAAVDDGVNVINLSLGLPSFDGNAYYNDPVTGEEKDGSDNMEVYNVLKKAVDYAEQHNVVVVTAIGNDSLDCSSPEKLTEGLNKLPKYKGFKVVGKSYLVPALLSNVINVSSTGKDDTISSFSNYGQGAVSVAAPGGDCVKTNKEGNIDINEFCLVTNNDGTYRYIVGTSLSAPKVSAEAALILCRNKNLTPKEVKEKIMSTCDKVGDEAHYGAGIINVYNALK